MAEASAEVKTVRIDTSGARRSAETHTYIMTGSGTHEGIDEKGARKLFKAGDEVELTDAQARAFRDKFKSKEVVEAEKKVAEAQAKAAEAKAKAEEDAAKAQADADKALLFGGKDPPASHSTEGTQT